MGMRGLLCGMENSPDLLRLRRGMITTTLVMRTVERSVGVGVIVVVVHGDQVGSPVWRENSIQGCFYTQSMDVAR